MTEMDNGSYALKAARRRCVAESPFVRLSDRSLGRRRPQGCYLESAACRELYEALTDITGRPANQKMLCAHKQSNRTISSGRGQRYVFAFLGSNDSHEYQQRRVTGG